MNIQNLNLNPNWLMPQHEHLFYEAVFLLMLRHDKLLDDLPGHSHVESPDFFSSGNDLVWGQDEPIVASVPQLHSITGENMKVDKCSIVHDYLYGIPASPRVQSRVPPLAG